jgi:hypothetical protein
MRELEGEERPPGVRKSPAPPGLIVPASLGLPALFTLYAYCPGQELVLRLSVFSLGTSETPDGSSLLPPEFSLARKGN